MRSLISGVIPKKLDIIKKELPHIEIINMNDRSHIADNILGIYKKEG